MPGFRSFSSGVGWVKEPCSWWGCSPCPTAAVLGHPWTISFLSQTQRVKRYGESDGYEPSQMPWPGHSVWQKHILQNTPSGKHSARRHATVPTHHPHCNTGKQRERAWPEACPSRASLSPAAPRSCPGALPPRPSSARLWGAQNVSWNKNSCEGNSYD